MEVYEAIRRRRSVRRYAGEALAKSVVERLVDAARWAPYGTGEVYPVEFVAASRQELKDSLWQTLRDTEWHEFVKRASAVIAVCRNTKVPGGVADAHAATQNLLLAATAEGLGTCWVGAFNPAQVQKVLAMPEHVVPVALVTVGPPAESPEPPERRPVSEILHWERYRG